MARIMLRLLVALPLASAVLLSQGPAVPDAAPIKYDYDNYVLAWYRKCGCTASNIEAVELLLDIIKINGEHRVRTNRCSDDCRWDWGKQRMLDMIAVEKDEDLVKPPNTLPESPVLVIAVVDSAGDVCKVPGDWLSSGQGIMRVSRSQFGTSKVSGDHVASCNQNFDAVWVPSWHDFETFGNSGVPAAKLGLLHQSQDLRRYECQAGVAGKTGVEELDEFLTGFEDTVTFLSVFDWEDRKNPITLIETFAKTFPAGSTTSDKTVRLVAQVNAASDPAAFADYMMKMPDYVKDAIGNGQILINTKKVPHDKMPGFYRAVDAFVLPTHGEGWGFSLGEAMASGLPVIATGYGGQMEFMDDSSSILVDYKMEKSSPEGDEWAVPDVESLRKAMLEVVNSPSTAQMKGKSACTKVADMTKPSAVAWGAHELIMALQTKYQQDGSVLNVQRVRP